MIDAVKAMSSSYALLFKDPNTTREELYFYLEFAHHMGLIPVEYGGTTNYVEEIAAELGLGAEDCFGAATLKYRLHYDAAALLAIFQTLDESELRDTSRDTLRSVASLAYRDFAPFRGVSEAYLEPTMRSIWRTAGLKTTVPGPFLSPAEISRLSEQS